jgi:hypothetical protein
LGNNLSLLLFFGTGFGFWCDCLSKMLLKLEVYELREYCDSKELKEFAHVPRFESFLVSICRVQAAAPAARERTAAWTG